MLAGLMILLASFIAGCSDDDPVTPEPVPAWEVLLDAEYTLRGVWGLRRNLSS